MCILYRLFFVFSVPEESLERIFIVVLPVTVHIVSTQRIELYYRSVTIQGNPYSYVIQSSQNPKNLF